MKGTHFFLVPSENTIGLTVASVPLTKVAAANSIPLPTTSAPTTIPRLTNSEIAMILLPEGLGTGAQVL